MSIYFLRTGHIWGLRIRQSDIIEAEEILQEVREQLDAAGTEEKKFAKHPGKLCAWCSFYKKQCDGGGQEWVK